MNLRAPSAGAQTRHAPNLPDGSFGSDLVRSSFLNSAQQWMGINLGTPPAPRLWPKLPPIGGSAVGRARRFAMQLGTHGVIANAVVMVDEGDRFVELRMARCGDVNACW